jgi:antitoxin component of RelBE/YafQ-DinJ toxin-antitoxin module
MPAVVAPSRQTAQINVRIDRAIKQAGDAALARRGQSPSEAVRELWRRLASEDARIKSDGPSQITLEESASPAAIFNKAEGADAEAALQRMFSRFEEFGRAWNLNLDDLPDDSSDDLRSVVMAEKRAAWAESDVA